MQKNRHLLLALIITLLAVFVPAAVAQANDYSNHWSAPYITDAANRGWMTGDGSGNYRPESAITRGEFAVMLWRSLDQPRPQFTCVFKDVSVDAYYYAAVAYLYEAGVVNGLDSLTFGPNITLTREMGCTMLARAFALTPVNHNSYQRFADYFDVSLWAQAAVSALVEKNYIAGVGDNKFAPKQQLKRGELAKLLITVYAGATTAQQNSAIISAYTKLTAGSPTIALALSIFGSDAATILVTATDDNEVNYIGWRSCERSSTYDSTSGFTNITSSEEFTVSSNGWYAVCSTNKKGGFSYKLIEVKHITDGPVPTLKAANPDDGKVTITVTLPSGSANELIGWRNSSENATYSNDSDLTKNTTAIVDNTFAVDENGWYAVFAANGNRFGYKLIHITGITSVTPATTYTLTVLKGVGNGEVEGGGTYKDGDTATAKAIEVSGYTFEGWYNNAACTGDSVSNLKTYEFPITKDTTLYAKFIENSGGEGDTDDDSDSDTDTDTDDDSDLELST